MNIAVIGTGYVGLVTGACFAEFGEVTCVDIDQKKIADLTAGIMPIYEPGLQELVERNAHAKRLRFTTNYKEAVESASVIFLAVGTPPNPDGTPNLSFVWSAARSVAEHMNGYKVIVTKSTVPIGTGKRLKTLISESLKSNVEFGIVSNPEFLREGQAISDFMEPDRVVLGSDDKRALNIMREIYRPLYVQQEPPFVITSLEAAELTKYAANAFLATKISFINEIANLCEVVDCDVKDVARAIGMDPRIGEQFLHPGPGFGGSCFPKDTMALASTAEELGCESLIVNAAIEVNRHQRQAMTAKIEKLVGNLKGATIAILGLAFKPETDDMREAPAIDIIRALAKGGATIRAYDPEAIDEARKQLPDIEYADDEYEAVANADALVFMTEWNQFRALDMKRVRELMKSPKIADLRNIYEPKDMKDLGFHYVGVGRTASGLCKGQAE